MALPRSLVVALVLGLVLVAQSGTTDGVKITKVVVAMLENRSFDHMIGMMKSNNTAIDGCTVTDSNPGCSNPMDPTVSGSPTVHAGNGAVYVQPADPNHSVPATTEQVYGYGPTSQKPAPMNGFIKNYGTVNPEKTGGGEFIMECFDPAHVPVITTLASNFALIDQWHCAIPGPTEVNRAYANSATSYGIAENSEIIKHLGLPQKTIWETLEKAGKDWGVYFEDFPSAALFRYTWGHLDKFHTFPTFLKDASEGKLPTYSWVEPRYYEDFGKAARDQHPDHDVAEGEMFIKQVYEAVRNGPDWNTTLLLVTYDEHGGFFDHVSPPINVPNPDGRVSTDPPFDFTRLGVRVPAVLVSPWIDANTVVHEPTVGGAYCHSSIPATLRKVFAPEEPFLTKRDAWAATFDDLLTRDSPRTDCPTSMPTPPLHRDTYGMLKPLDGKMPVSDLQRGFSKYFAAITGDDSVTDEALDAMTEGEASRQIRVAVNKWLGREEVEV